MKHKTVCRSMLFAAGLLLACCLWQPQLAAALRQALLDVVLPPLWGWLLTLALSPLYVRLCRSMGGGKTARALAAVCCYLLLFALLAGALLILLPQLLQSLRTLQAHGADYRDNLRRLGLRLRERLSLPPISDAARQQTVRRLLERLFGRLGQLLEQVMGVTAGALKGLLQLVLGLFFSVYFLTDDGTLAADAAAALRVWLPGRAEQILTTLRLGRRMMSGWLTGQLLDSALMGLGCGLGMVLLGFSYPVLVGLLAFFGSMIPLVGGAAAGVLGFLLLLAAEPLQAVWFVVYYTVIEQLEGRFLYPRIVGSRLGLPPLLVLLGLLLGSELCGLLGVLLSLPLTAVLYAAARRATARRKKSGCDTAERRATGADAPRRPASDAAKS